MATVSPAAVDQAMEVCRRWGVEARRIGSVTGDGIVTVRSGGEVVAQVPGRALADASPALDRPSARPMWLEELGAEETGAMPPPDLAEALLQLLGSPSVASKRWIWEQYDHMILLGTVGPPGGDAAVIRLPDSPVAVALSLDGPGRSCALDPYEGARLAVAEAARNVACTGARPAAVTDCLNLGNPTKPEVMWQLKEVVRGIGEACAALGTPVIGGNVSLYNETEGTSIHPTPVIGMLGILSSAAAAVPHGLRRPGEVLVLLGETDPEAFGGSDYASVVEGRLGGRPPRVDLSAERSLIDLLCSAAEQALLASAHDLGGGGLAVCLAESAIAGGVGFRVALPPGEPHLVLFSESPGRAVVSCSATALGRLLGLARDLGVPCAPIGEVGGDILDFEVMHITLEQARATFEDALSSHLLTRVQV